MRFSPSVPAFVLGLALGVAAGSWCQRAFIKRGPANDETHRRVMLDRLGRSLSLDEKQKAAVAGVMDSRAADVDRLKAETFVRLQEIRKSADAEMSKILTAEQVQKLAAMHQGRPMRINWEAPSFSSTR